MIVLAHRPVPEMARRWTGIRKLLLGALLLCCMVDVASAKDQWSGRSVDGLYQVTIEPESGEVKIGEMQRWIVTVKTSDDEPVFPAKIFVGGGMQGHGHGLPTQPQAVAYGGDGAYLVEGVRFNMEGTWRLSFVIDAAAGNDRVDFDIALSF